MHGNNLARESLQYNYNYRYILLGSTF